MKRERHPVGDGPLISVVMPVFNGETYIAEALDSVFAQTYQPFEVIVVDDGSTDRTLQRVRSYGERVRVLTQQNRGNASARNNGVLMARGDWIAQLDADDRWDPTKLEKQVRHVNSADVIYTGALNFGDSSRVDEITFRDRDCPAGDVFDQLVADNFITHSSVLIRTSVMRATGGYDETLKNICDWDLLLRLSAAGAQFAGCREPLTHYRWRAASVSRDHHRARKNRLAVVERALTSARGQRLSWARKRMALSQVWRTSAWFAGEHDDWTAFKWYAEGLMIWPLSASAWRDFLRSGLRCCGISRERFLKVTDSLPGK